MSDTGPLTAEPIASEEELTAPKVWVLLTLVPDADVEAAVAVVDRQAYEPAPEIHVIGDPKGDELGPSVTHHPSLEEAIRAAPGDVDYLWLLHSDARPRPDALAALVSETERNEASLAGSKLLKAGTPDELESVGGATDVFGEPYSGLDEGEIDLQQYDVVREVSFVTSASMLVRRDLARGLRGLDPLLPPVAAGLDFSQRTRLAGGRVITVPSSEVYHQGRCNQRGSGWREQAGRLRAMVTAYSPMTLLWVLPYDFVVSLLDSIASLLLLRWKPIVRHALAWAWNTIHLPSTFGQRRRFRKVRSTGDEELFRFQAKGSVRLRSVGEELSNRFLSLFDDDQALVRSSERVWRSPGIWGAIIAALVVVLASRGLMFGEVPNTGFAFPFEPPTDALSRWFGGWNDSGLGSPSPVHPSVGLTGALSWLWFGAEGATRTLLTIGAGFLAVVGMGRLGGRIGLRGPGRYLSGLVLIAGPALASLVGHGSWLALVAAAVLPWAVRGIFVHGSDSSRWWGRAGWVVVSTVVLAMLSPVLAVLPLTVALIWRFVGTGGSSLKLGVVSLIGGVAGAGFVAANPDWLFDSDRLVGTEFSTVWVIVLLVSALAMMLTTGLARRVAAVGGLLGAGALFVLKIPGFGPGIEEALAVTAAFGAALVLAAALDRFDAKSMGLAAAAGAVGMLVLVAGTLVDGRLGLPEGDVNARLGFADTLAGDSGPGRILHASVDPTLIPGEVRSGPGYWYRILDGSGTTHDEIFLPDRESGDLALASSLVEITTGADLRPGALLAEFAVDWVVLEGPAFRLDEVLTSQLDLIPTPLDRNARVFENPNAQPLAGAGDTIWSKQATGFGGEVIDTPVFLSLNFSDGWGPDAQPFDWATTVDGSEGVATYSGDPVARILAVATVAVFFLGLVAIVVGRRKS